MRCFLSSLFSFTFIYSTIAFGSPLTPINITFIVNSKNEIREIDVNELANFYMKRKRTWADGTPVRFIDRKVGSVEREQFINSILKLSQRKIDLFWIGQKLYTGDAAPMQVSSSAEVTSLVAAFPGAIGYIAGPIVPKKGIKRIELKGALTP